MPFNVICIQGSERVKQQGRVERISLPGRRYKVGNIWRKDRLDSGLHKCNESTSTETRMLRTKETVETMVITGIGQVN